jgi:hypothetical protein
LLTFVAQGGELGVRGEDLMKGGKGESGVLGSAGAQMEVGRRGAEGKGGM